MNVSIVGEKLMNFALKIHIWVLLQLWTYGLSRKSGVSKLLH